MDILRSLLGMLFLLLVAYLLSNNRRAVSGRTLIAALCTQLAIGALVLFVPVGRAVLAGAANGVNRVLDMGNHGIAFVFGGPSTAGCSSCSATAGSCSACACCR